jgi:glucokinase
MAIYKNNKRTSLTARRLILDIVDEKGPISPVDMAQISGYSQPAVTGAVRWLLEQGLLKEVGMSYSTGGRRARLLDLSGDAGNVIAIDIGGTKIRIATVDFRGQVLCLEDYETPKKDVICFIEERVREVIDVLGADNIKACGVGVPGIVDNKDGIIKQSPAVHFPNIDICYHLTKRLELPFVVENDVNLAAYAELRYGHGREMGDFVFIAVGTGIGAGLVINGELYRGSRGSSGEVGFMMVNRDFLLSEEGYGCLESLASGKAIEELYEKKNRGNHQGQRTAKDIFRLAALGDAIAKKIVAESTQYLAMGVASVWALLDPEAIILGGGVMNAKEDLVVPLTDCVEKMVLDPPRILLSKLEDNATLLGAGALALGAVKDIICEV